METSAIPLLLCCNTRLAQLKRLRLQFQSVLATLRGFDAEKCSISWTNIYFIPVSYSLTSELWSSGPAEAAHVAAGPLLHPTQYITYSYEVWRGFCCNVVFLSRGGSAFSIPIVPTINSTHLRFPSNLPTPGQNDVSVAPHAAIARQPVSHSTVK